MTTIVVIILITWLILTVFNQINPLRKSLSFIFGYDVLGMIPLWTFFAPNPGDTDTHVLYRDRNVAGNVGAWKEIDPIIRENIFDCWNPKRRLSKAVVDIIPDLLQSHYSNTNNEEVIKKTVNKRIALSFPYLLILNYVCMQPRDPFAETRQFAIARTEGFQGRKEPFVLLLSSFHKFDESE